MSNQDSQAADAAHAWPSFLPIIGGMAVVVAAATLLAERALTLTPHHVVIGLALLIAFVVVSLIPHRTNISWLGYPQAILMVAWLTTGLFDALAVTIAGALLVGAAYQVWGERLGLLAISREQIIRWTFGRIAISGAALLVATVIYVGMSQPLPLTDVSSSNLLPFGLAYVMALLTAHLLASLLFGRNLIETGRALWTSERRSLLLLELILPLAVISSAIVISRLGEFVFLAILALGTAEIVSARLANEAKHHLSEKVEELSLLNAMGESISSSLVMDDLLQQVYAQVKAITSAPAFYIALFDDDRRRLDYRLVMVDGEPASAPPLTENSLAATLTRSPTVLHIGDLDLLRLLGITPSELEARYADLCALPLMAGNEALGVMVVLKKQGETPLNTRTINLLRAVAGQAALAIHNANLYAHSTEMARYLSLINNSVQSAVTHIDRENAAEMICAAAQTIARADGVALFLYNRQTQALDLAYSVGLSSETQSLLAAMPHITRQLDSESFVIPMDEDSDDGRTLREFAQRACLDGLIDATLRSNTALVGYLTLVYDQPHVSSPTELNLLETLTSQVSTALENTRLFQALENYAFEMSQLAHLSRVSTSNLNVETTMRSVGQILCQIMNVSRTTIVLANESGALSSLTATGSAAQTGGMDAPDAISFPELAALFDHDPAVPRAYQAADDDLSPELSAFMSQSDEATLAVVPLLINDRTMGAILLGSHTRRQFTDREWQLVEMASNQTATHLQNAQLYTRTNEALRERMEQLALIEDIARQISSALDFQQIVSNLLKAAAHITQADYVSLILRTLDPRLQTVYETRADGLIEQATYALSDDIGMFGAVVRAGKALLVDNHQTAPNYVPPPGQRAFHSSAVVPLIRDNRVIGVLNMESTRRNFFREAQLPFLNSLADHAVISIGKARMLDERKYQVETLSSLQAMALRLAGEMDPPSVANVILETTLSLFGGLEAAIFFYDDRSGELTPLNRLTRDGRRSTGVLGLISPEIAVEAAQTGEVQILRQDASSSSIHLPLKRGNRVREVLAIGFDTPQAFGERDLESLGLLASQAAGHLENAVLNQQMRAILNSTRDGILLFDGKRRLVEANPAADHLLGGGWDPYVSQTAAQLPRLSETSADTISRRHFEHQNASGPIYLEETSMPVTDSKQRAVGWLVILRDVTEEKRLADYRDEISHMVVHDLRGPLASIMSSLSLAMDELPASDEAEFARQAIHLSTDSANSLMVLVESMLDVARLEAQAMKLDIQPTEARWLARQAAQALSATIQQAGIRLTIDLPDDLPPLAVDGDMIRRVVINLLDNAVRYTPFQGQVLITAASADGWLTFRLADSGPGIPPNERDQVFEKFRQAQKPGSVVRRRGSGLGLTFCKLAIEAHGGKIWIESGAPLSGACFVFTLPLLDISDDALRTS